MLFPASHLRTLKHSGPTVTPSESCVLHHHTPFLSCLTDRTGTYRQNLAQTPRAGPVLAYGQTHASQRWVLSLLTKTLAHTNIHSHTLIACLFTLRHHRQHRHRTEAGCRSNRRWNQWRASFEESWCGLCHGNLTYYSPLMFISVVTCVKTSLLSHPSMFSVQIVNVLLT